MRPLLPLTIAFAVGLVAGRHYMPGYSVLVLFFVLSLLPFLLFALFVRKNDRNLFIEPRYLAVVPFFLLGMLYIKPLAAENVSWERYLHRGDSGSERIEGIVRGAENMVSRTNYSRKRVYVEARKIGDTKVGGDGLLMLTLENYKDALLRGDYVRFDARLSSPKNFGTPGVFDYEWWLRRGNVALTGKISASTLVVLERGGGLLAKVDEIRHSYSKFVDDREIGSPGLLKALTIGDRSLIPEKTNDEFVETGIAHLIAISGLNIGFVAAVFYLLTSFLLKRSEKIMLEYDVRKIAVFAAFFPALTYALISGFAVSTQRAVLMTGAGMLVVALGRLKDIYNVIALTALVLLLFNPGYLWDASFQLSFAAVIAIVYLSPQKLWKEEKEIKKDEDMENEPWWAWSIKWRVKILFFVSLAAALGTMPILAGVFNRVSLITVVSNMAIVPLAGGIATPLSVLSIILYPLSDGLAWAFGSLAGFVLGLSAWLNGFFALIPHASIRVPTPTVAEVAAFYVLLLALPHVKTYKRIALVLGVVIVFIAVDAAYWRAQASTDKTLDVTFLSVGQGDSALIEFPSHGGKRKNMLIDGGGAYKPSFDAGEDVIARYLWQKRITSLDYMVLSHPQRDHMGGLVFLSKHFSTKEFWWSGAGILDGEIEENVRANNGVVLVKNNNEKTIEIDGVRIEFLWPPPGANSAENESSLVMRICYVSDCFLFTGDIGVNTEKRLLENELKASVLKVAHHGSGTSTSPEFLKAVKPESAVISVGRNNPFGFPDPETIKKLRSAEADVLRTDEQGAVSFVSSGTGIVLKHGLTGSRP